MKYRSTRGEKASRGVFSLSEAIRQGLAADGGLFVPETWPSLSSLPSPRAFSEFSAEVLVPFFVGDGLAAELPELTKRAFDFPLVLREWEAKASVLELFHGPTLAFKDFGARFLATCLTRLTTREPLVLVATSGDTGGAVAAAFASCTKIPVVILYPEGKISARQEKQLTVWGDQVRAFAVKGTFDDCQRMVKEAFLTAKWRERFDLISANSINIARLLPQMACFAWASMSYQERTGKPAGFIVPTGNAGNVVGALWARKLGFPIREVVFAHNANRTIPDYFASGVFSPRASVATLANAMDVGAPSNFERVKDLYPDLRTLTAVASAYAVTDNEIQATIKSEYLQSQNVFCPHTATAICVRRQMKSEDWVVVATAHPAKFETILEPLLGIELPVPQALEVLLTRESRKTQIEPSCEVLEKYIF